MNTKANYDITPPILFTSFILGIGGVLWFLSLNNFPLFHTSVELTTIAMSAGVIFVGWSSRHEKGQHFLWALALVYASSGFVDLLHTFTYKGTGFFPEAGANIPTQFWLLARLIESFGLALLFWFSQSAIKCRTIFLMAPFIAGFGVLSIYPLGLFPEAFIDGVGLTPFKVFSEYVIIGGFVLAMLGLNSSSVLYSLKQKKLYLAALAVSALAEFFFTQYVSVFDQANAVGHFFRLISYLLLYQAIIEPRAMAQYRFHTKLNVRPFFYASLVVLIMISMAYGVFQYQKKMHVADETERALLTSAEIANSLSFAMASRLSLADSLAAYYRANPNITERDFEAFAEPLHHENPGIISLQLAPDAVVRFVTDKDRNAAAIGHDLRADPNRRQSVSQAIRERAFIISGPVNLIQGGRAIIARKPIFLDSNPDIKTAFWGFATVLVDFDVLMKNAISAGVSRHYQVAVRGADAKGPWGAVIYGEPGVFESPLATALVSLHQGTWQIGLKRHDSFIPKNIVLQSGYWLALLFTIFPAWIIVYRIFNRPYELRQEVEKATLELRKEIERRTQTEEELRKHKDDLQYEIGVKNRLFSIISHDLKSPFASLLGMTRVMSQMADNLTKEKLTEYATNVNKSGDRVFVLLQNLLEWSQFQMEGVELQPEEVRLRDVSRDSIEILMPNAEEKDITLTNNVEQLSVFADLNMVRAVMRNLIANAIKFTPPGGRVELSAHKDGGMVKVTVSDTGIGMSKEHAGKVFALDQKTSTKGTSGEPGTGLGLPLCKEMVEKNGGRIWLETVPDKGSQFYFTLPAFSGAQ